MPVRLPHSGSIDDEGPPLGGPSGSSRRASCPTTPAGSHRLAHSRDGLTGRKNSRDRPLSPGERNEGRVEIIQARPRSPRAYELALRTSRDAGGATSKCSGSPDLTRSVAAHTPGGAMRRRLLVVLSMAVSVT